MDETNGVDSYRKILQLVEQDPRLSLGEYSTPSNVAVFFTKTGKEIGLAVARGYPTDAYRKLSRVMSREAINKIN